MTLPNDLRASCDELRRMVSFGIRPTANELLRLATRLENAAERLDDMVVHPGEVVRLRPALGVVKGAR